MRLLILTAAIFGLFAWLGAFSSTDTENGAAENINATKSSIADILNSPISYRNKPITVSGRVSQTASLGKYGSFVICDNSGSLRIYTSSGLPSLGDSRTVHGHVIEILKLQSYQVIAIREN